MGVADEWGCDPGDVTFVTGSGKGLAETSLTFALRIKAWTTKHNDKVCVYITPLEGGEEAYVQYRLQEDVTLGMLRDKVAEIFSKPRSDLKLLADSTRLLSGPDSEV